MIFYNSYVESVNYTQWYEITCDPFYYIIQNCISKIRLGPDAWTINWYLKNNIQILKILFTIFQLIFFLLIYTIVFIKWEQKEKYIIQRIINYN